MKTPALREVRLRLEFAVENLPDKPASRVEEFERYQSIAIAVLDSEHDSYPPGVLERYLSLLLDVISLECGTAKTDKTRSGIVR